MATWCGHVHCSSTCTTCVCTVTSSTLNMVMPDSNMPNVCPDCRDAMVDWLFTSTNTTMTPAWYTDDASHPAMDHSVK